MITPLKTDYNIIQVLETTIYTSDYKDIEWKLKRDYYETNRLTLWNGYGYLVLFDVLHLYDKRWIKANKPTQLAKILQKRKLRS